LASSKQSKMFKILYSLSSLAFCLAFSKCKNPKGSIGDTYSEGCYEFTCKPNGRWAKENICQGREEGFTGCPSSLTYGGGSQKYRFVEDVLDLPSPQYSPCKGDIERCIYTAHRKYYCMNGYKPEYTPFELQPHHDQFTLQTVKTFAGVFEAEPSKTNFTIPDPDNQPDYIKSLELIPNIYQNAYIVLGGLNARTYNHHEQIGNQTVGTPTGPNPTTIYIELGAGITEIFGVEGDRIGQLTFRVTPPNPHAEPRQYTFDASFYGAAFDATPPPKLNGPCDLLTIGGQTSGDFGDYIQALEFTWRCVGKPTHYTY